MLGMLQWLLEISVGVIAGQKGDIFKRSLRFGMYMGNTEYFCQ